ncbi:uncharacterized protein K444DRAFT_614226 [Hyaloscypha bicolor E]|uniref:Uncharacterized protein n=1 Tax=Hyaloscypha bicolor E TaxID=1095630 RepID=A0A2J6T612_9HELO|nr:uncharacterized protein K444DRAFT_614226 [Hyaloscypha bicolor E]PMD58456.1 hypothetical protein K444DRAFT_614226 [Hyaloscypha bicolor E]
MSLLYGHASFATIILNFPKAGNGTIIVTLSKIPKITSLPNTFSITREIYGEHSMEVIAMSVRYRSVNRNL